MKLATPRVPPVEEADWTPEQKEVLGRSGQPGKVHNVFKTLGNHVKLAKRWFPFANHILFKSTLPARDREILILRIARLTGAEYEWSHHTRIGKEAGLTDDDIERIVAGPDAAGWSDFDAALVRAVDELHAEQFISDATWKALSARYGTEQMMDAIFTVGNYNMLAMALNSMGVQLDPGNKGFDG